MRIHENILKFPDEFSLGRIAVFLEGHSEPETLLEARGTVHVPEHTTLHFDVSQNVCDNLQRIQLVPNCLLANGVNIVQKRLDQTDFTPLRAIPNLKALAISGCGVIRTQQLDQLGRLDSLEHLDLSGTELNRPEFYWLGQFLNLRWISLCGSSADEGCLGPLSNLPQLEHVDVRRAKLTDEGVQSFWSFRRLNNLILGNCDIGDDAMQGMDRCHLLRGLHLSGTHLSDAGVENIVRQSAIGRLQIRSLVLRGCQVTDRSLVYLSSLDSMRMIDILGTLVTGNGVSFLKSRLPQCSIIVEGSKA